MKKQTKEHVEKRISKIRGKVRNPSPFRKTTEQVVQAIQQTHGDRYLIDRVQYVNCKTKIELGCKIHGYFFKYPNDALRGGGCPRCGNSFRKTREEFINEALCVFPEYDYSKVVYKNAHTPTVFICPVHGEFITKPNTILSAKSGCRECGPIRALNSRVQAGLCRHTDQISEHEKYKKLVWRETNKSFREHFPGQRRDRSMHLDHIVSITDGWLNKVPPEIIGSVVNLRLLDGSENRKKATKSDMSIQLLYNLYEDTKKK